MACGGGIPERGGCDYYQNDDCDQGMALSCLAVGHSFMRNWRKYINTNYCKQHYYKPAQLACGARVFFHGVKTLNVRARGGATVADLQQELAVTASHDMLLVELGTNDICNVNVSGSEVADEILKLVKEQLDQGIFKIANICQIVARWETREREWREFETERDAFNAAIRQGIRGRSDMFYFKQSGLGDVVNEWSHDLIHPTEKWALDKYFHNVRGAILDMAQVLKNSK